MAFRSLQRRLKKDEPGFALMEAVTAAGFAAVALSASLVILNKQMEIADRARGLAMVQAAINEDINAVRHQARKWYWTNSFFNNPALAANPPNMMLYDPDVECHAWDSKGKLERNAFTDFVLYGTVPGELSLPNMNNLLISKTVPGYQIRRVYSFPAVSSQINNNTAVSEEAPYTLRVTYTVSKVRAGQNGASTLTAFPYTQTADIQFYAQFSC